MIGFCLTGSFCSFEKSISILQKISEKYDILPIMSHNAYGLDTKFGKAEDHRKRIEEMQTPFLLLPDSFQVPVQISETAGTSDQ